MVKVGDKFYSSHEGPIMFIMSKEDKVNISNMPEDKTRYASFPCDFQWSDETICRKWMNSDRELPDV